MMYLGLSCVLWTFDEIAPEKFPISVCRAMPTLLLCCCPARLLSGLVRALMISYRRRHVPNNPSTIKNQITRLVNPSQASNAQERGVRPSDAENVLKYKYSALLDASGVLMENLTRQEMRPEEMNGQRTFSLSEQWAKTVPSVLRWPSRHQAKKLPADKADPSGGSKRRSDTDMTTSRASGNGSLAGHWNTDPWIIDGRGSDVP